MLTWRIDSKGRAAQTLAKGPSKKRSRAEFEESKEELSQLKKDKWGFVHQTKRLRTEVEEMRQVIAMLKGQQVEEVLEDQNQVPQQQHAYIQSRSFMPFQGASGGGPFAAMSFQANQAKHMQLDQQVDKVQPNFVSDDASSCLTPCYRTR